MSLPCTASTETEMLTRITPPWEGRNPENVASQASILELTRPAWIAFSTISWPGSPPPLGEGVVENRGTAAISTESRGLARAWNQPARTREGFQWFA